MDKATILKSVLVLVLVLFCCFVLQVRDSFTKFVKAQTTLVSNRKVIEREGSLAGNVILSGIQGQ